MLDDMQCSVLLQTLSRQTLALIIVDILAQKADYINTDVYGPGGHIENAINELQQMREKARIA